MVEADRYPVPGGVAHISPGLIGSLGAVGAYPRGRHPPSADRRQSRATSMGMGLVPDVMVQS